MRQTAGAMAGRVKFDDRLSPGPGVKSDARTVNPVRATAITFLTVRVDTNVFKFLMIYHVYCDESRQVRDRFMVLGGIIIPSGNVAGFDKSMQKFRAEQNMHAELKWTKVSKQKIDQYRRFIDYFFAQNNADKLHFHALMIDNHKVNHAKFNQGDKELGFYKFYYQLLLNCFGRRYCAGAAQHKIHVYLDYRNSRYSLEELKTILNAGIRKRWGVTTSPFRAIEPRDSKKSEIIQLNDIVLGAIGFQKNGYELIEGSNPAKQNLMTYIAEQAGLKNLKDGTPISQRRFTLWNFQLRK
jgi:hypothetical protein